MRRKVLFVCSRNQWRSPTAARVYRGSPLVDARSAGTSKHARTRVTEALVHWASLICVMEGKHRDRLRAQFPQALRGCEVVVLDIPDDYRFMDPELVELIHAQVDPLVSASDDPNDD